MKIAIIGGGIAGLSAAAALRNQSPIHRVDLFEASDRLGGAIRTERIDGFLVEHGADMFATEPSGAIELCRELGIEADLIAPRPEARGAAIVHRGKLVRVPAGFVLMRPTRLGPILTTPLLSLQGKLRLLAEPAVAKRANDDDESVAAFVKRRFGNELLRTIVQPLVGGIYTGDVDKLSMAATMPQFWEMERTDGSLYRATRRRHREGSDSIEQNSAGARYEKFRSFPAGMECLVAALVKSLGSTGLHRSTAIESLRKIDDRWQLIGSAPIGDQTYDHVIIATPANVAGRLLADVIPAAATWASDFRFASSAVVALGVHDADITHRMSIAGFVVPAAEHRQIIAASYTGDKFSGRTPAGMRLIRVFIGGELQADLLERSDSDLVELARNELRSLIGLQGQPVLAKVIRWPSAMPQYHVGHLNRVSAMESSIACIGGLSLIGNSLHGVGIAPTILHARKVAAMILAAR